MQALLLIAHGSRREASNQEVRDLAEKLGKIASDQFQLVVPAFLELADPDIPTGVAHCVEAGATDVTAVPYFLSAGRHVATDIPVELERAAKMNPDISVNQSDYLGTYSGLPKILLTLAASRVEIDASSNHRDDN